MVCVLAPDSSLVSDDWLIKVTSVHYMLELNTNINKK